ncbi:hypothetical protein H5410_056516 [Solanum commersonii]|uniref:Uncharacterized protein n=1 Tax=Solanum commersonii TaxID=4109 RepID=A0A9J5WNA9_SOLCO|nr:hypothetical protein H5410_056516 [Solanum commersonii]
MDVRQDHSYGFVHGSFGDQNFRCHFCQKNLWTSVKTLAMEPIGFDQKTNPFSRSNKPRSGFLWTSVETLAIKLSMDLLVIQISDVIFAESFCGHPLRPCDAAGWSRLANWSISKSNIPWSS